jgi:hypothetical protein
MKFCKGEGGEGEKEGRRKRERKGRKESNYG